MTTLQLNLTKPYHLSDTWTLLWTHTCSLFVPFGVKPCLLLLLLLLYINFVTFKSRSSPFFKSCHPNLYCCWSKVYSFTKRRNKPGFPGLIKIPIRIVVAFTSPPRLEGDSPLFFSSHWYALKVLLRTIRGHRLRVGVSLTVLNDQSK